MTKEEIIKNLQTIEEDGWNVNSEAFEAVKLAIKALEQSKWIPVSERLPEHSYTQKFWLTVKLDNGTITTLIGEWSGVCRNESEKFDAFMCWKDEMINGNIYRISKPIPREQVIAWMPLPEPYKAESEE